ncbi:MAG TPA: transposase [Gemmataceae bacterium]|nr:transposase [Gemmataceae bacterium]
MLSSQGPTAQPATSPPARIGVGIDTSRYGHYAAFLRDDLQPACAELQFAESAQGYAQLRHRLGLLAGRHHAVCFAIRLDAAGQYADNLLHFLHQLARHPQQQTCAWPNSTITLSSGDPHRNKNYRAALFGGKKSDPVEARAAARFALSERPTPTPALAAPLRALRQVAARLQATVRQRTRLINQLHHLLALAFPELALLVKDLALGWVLELVHRYPTAALLANAKADDLACIPYLHDRHIAGLLEQARGSIASLSGPTTEELVRDQVRQLRDASARQQRLEGLLVTAYRALPKANHLDSIPGIGAVTAAVLTAFTLDIERFETPGKLVAYFGVLPVEVSSGVDRDGQPRGPRRYIMSRRGNDLVRRYLWMAALSAVRCNPAVRPLYRRVVAKHPDHKAVAIGHAMRKLLHLAFAVWKSDRPFDGRHHPWEGPPAALAATAEAGETPAPQPRKSQAAGHKPEASPAEEVVTAACAGTVAAAEPVGEGTFINFAHLKQQLSLAQVLEHLGLSGRLRGSGPQRRCACPIHRGDGRGRTFSVNLPDNVFCCFEARCGQQGDVIDLWAALHHLDLRAAALDLVRTFDLEPAPARPTEKRDG